VVVRTASRAGARSAQDRRTALVTLGPFAVARSSAATLRAVLAASFSLNLVLVSALVFARRRLARDRASGSARGGSA
jgi:hypothetical protein